MSRDAIAERRNEITNYWGPPTVETRYIGARQRLHCRAAASNLPQVHSQHLQVLVHLRRSYHVTKSPSLTNGQASLDLSRKPRR